MTSPFACLILAAGHGTRMNSSLLKPLHKVAGRSMLAHVIAAAESLGPERIVTVIGPDMQPLADAAAPHATAVQEKPLGTGDAVRAGMKALGDFEGDVLVLYADTPLISTPTLQKLLARRKDTDDPAVVITSVLREPPNSFGRIVLDAVGRPQRIVEERDATDEQKRIKTCNGGIMLFKGSALPGLLEKLETNNAQKAYYLTDTVAIARTLGYATAVVETPLTEIAGVNSRAELAETEQLMQQRLRQKAMQDGVTLIDPTTVWLSWDTKFSRDVVVGPNVFFGPGVSVGEGTEIRAFSHLEDTIIGARCDIGPFARLRTKAVIKDGAKIGNFVEVCRSEVGEGTKAYHLSYLGDATVGAGVNIGAGVITCNYDGKDKHRTEIGDGAFVGSNTALIAPISVGQNAIVAAGSVITEEVPDDALSIERGELKIIKGRGMNARRKS